MKKEILYITYLLLLSVVFVASCQKIDNDRVPPVIIINGNNPQWLILGCEYNDAGIEIVDDKSEVFDVYIADNIKSDSIGDYYVKYTVIDSDSNISVALRKVVVEPFSIDDYVANYIVKDTVKPLGPSGTYQASVSIFNTSVPIMKIANFNDFGNNFEAFFTSDSAGAITLTYDQNDTLIDGTGTTFCDKTGFRLEFLIELPDGFSEYHNTTFKLNGKN
jgi:hypothetical protein